MTYYLIDTENVAGRWTGIARKAAPGDMFLLFYTDESKKPDPDALAAASLQGASFRFLKCCAGRENALDFQLTAYLGILRGEHPDATFVILSDDKRYDPAIAFLHDMGMDVRREAPEPEPSREAARPEAPTPETTLERDRAEVARLYAEYMAGPDRKALERYIPKLRQLGVTDEQDVEAYAAIILRAMEYPTHRTYTVYHSFLSKYGWKDGRARYSIIKGYVHALADEEPFPILGGAATPGGRAAAPAPQHAALRLDPKTNLPVLRGDGGPLA